MVVAMRNKVFIKYNLSHLVLPLFGSMLITGYNAPAYRIISQPHVFYTGPCGKVYRNNNAKEYICLTNGYLPIHQRVMTAKFHRYRPFAECFAFIRKTHNGTDFSAFTVRII